MTTRPVPSFLAVAALLALSPAASAKGISYDCDTAADHFSELRLPAGPAPFTVTGGVQLRNLAPSKQYVAVARIQVASAAEPGTTPDAYAGFALTAMRADAKKSSLGKPAVQTLSYSVKGEEDEVLPSSLMDQPGGVQAFRLTYDGSAVAVTIGGETRSFAVQASEPVVRLACSTGEFLFTDLLIVPGR